MKNEIAILMAAGKGERMRPITLTTPKPLVKVNGIPMIETVIGGLLRRDVSQIYVVVGYLKEMFEYLPIKYSNVVLIENNEFMLKNNISSIYAVSDIMGNEDCFICEADLYVSDPQIFDVKLEKSCYYGKMIQGHSDDWVMDMDGDRIVRIGKCGDDTYNMCGISYFKKEDAKAIAKAIKAAYMFEGHEQMFWDEVVDRELKNIYLTVNPVLNDQIVEIDSVDELQNIDSSYSDVC